MELTRSGARGGGGAARHMESAQPTPQTHATAAHTMVASLPDELSRTICIYTTTARVTITSCQQDFGSDEVTALDYRSPSCDSEPSVRPSFFRINDI